MIDIGAIRHSMSGAVWGNLSYRKNIVEYPFQTVRFLLDLSSSDQKVKLVVFLLLGKVA